MTKPPDLCPRTLRWCADEANAEAQTAEENAGSMSHNRMRYTQLCLLWAHERRRRRYRARATRIEKKKEAEDE